MFFDLPDPAQWTGSEAVMLPIYKEHVDVTAHEFAAGTAVAWHLTPLQTKDGFGRARGVFCMVGDWLMSESCQPPALIEMGTRHLVEGATHVDLERYVSGEERGREGEDKTLLNRPGTLQFCDQQQTLKSIASTRCVQDITLPRALLDLPEDEPVMVPSVTPASAFGQLVFAEWDALYDHLKSGALAFTQSQLDRFAACVKIAMGLNPQREDVRAHARDALFRQICRYIETKLEDPHLSTSTLLDQFGVSRATLYRMFEPLGGVRNYLTDRRAGAALFFLSKSNGRRGFVQAACERWGFSSPANFNRTIQRLFGNSPKALLFAREGIGRNSYDANDFVTDFLSIRHDGGTGALDAAAA
ncbi:MAG: AraC family transcriptional regulator [Pseudomonadota bacterium]